MMEIASGPDKRINAIAPVPLGVANATMVSSLAVIINFLGG